MKLKLASSQADLISQTLILQSKGVTKKGCNYIFPYVDMNDL